MLILMFIILVYPPLKGYYYNNEPMLGRKEFLFLLNHPITEKINFRNLIPKLLAVAFLGSALVILFGLEKKKR